MNKLVDTNDEKQIIENQTLMDFLFSTADEFLFSLSVAIAMYFYI